MLFRSFLGFLVSLVLFWGLGFWDVFTLDTFGLVFVSFTVVVINCKRRCNQTNIEKLVVLQNTESTPAKTKKYRITKQPTSIEVGSQNPSSTLVHNSEHRLLLAFVNIPPYPNNIPKTPSSARLPSR